MSGREGTTGQCANVVKYPGLEPVLECANTCETAIVHSAGPPQWLGKKWKLRLKHKLPLFLGSFNDLRVVVFRINNVLQVSLVPGEMLSSTVVPSLSVHLNHLKGLLLYQFLTSSSAPHSAAQK